MAQINKPSDYFNTLLRNGTGTGNTAVTGVGFQPDLVWQKRRNTTGNHFWTDVVRGSSNKIYSSSTAAEETDANWVVSFDSDGYTMGSSDYGTSDTVVSWNWLGANASSSNTDGSITSSVSANTTSGFSIVKYTGNGTGGATVGHGLGVAPSVLIHKKRTTSAEAWSVFHQSVGITKRMILSSTEAATADASPQPDWNDVLPTSSVFTIGTSSRTNATEDYICYAFAEKKGFSKFGSYTGNGSTDGTFVYTGFKPAWVMLKSTSLGTEGWFMYDNTRSESNPTNDALLANLSNAEYANSGTFTLDLLSNGFKLKNSDGSHNGSSQSYIYMCFAEQPLVGTNNIPATAR